MKTSKSIKLSFLILIISAGLCGCIYEGTSNSSARLTEDYTKVSDEIRSMAYAERVSFEDFETKRGDKVIKKELRIDLTKPYPFPDEIKVKEIILAVKSKLIDSAKFDTYTIAEVPLQEGNTIIIPAQKILKSVTIDAKDL